jgi:hypothetical protein
MSASHAIRSPWLAVMVACTLSVFVACAAVSVVVFVLVSVTLGDCGPAGKPRRPLPIKILLIVAERNRVEMECQGIAARISMCAL